MSFCFRPAGRRAGQLAVSRLRGPNGDGEELAEGLLRHRTEDDHGDPGEVATSSADGGQNRFTVRPSPVQRLTVTSVCHITGTVGIQLTALQLPETSS